MLGALLLKDLRRARRNPLPWLINLALPLLITGLIGLAFGGKSEQGLGRIRFAVVDEDQTTLTGFLRGAMNQTEGSKYLEPLFIDREEALRQIQADKLSGVLIIPTNFTRHYLLGTEPVKLELIKNPAQSIHPTVLEELFALVVTGLNAIARNFQSEFPEWQAAFEHDFDYHKLSGLIESVGQKLDTVRKLIRPPLVALQTSGGGEAGGLLPFRTSTTTPTTTETVTPSQSNQVAQAEIAGESNHLANVAKLSASNHLAQTPLASETGATTKPAGSNQVAQAAKPAAKGSPKPAARQAAPIFAYLLLGMTAMFLLFLAGNGMSDLHREMRFRTFERYQTLREKLMPFVAGKMIYGVIMLLICSLIMLGGGGLVFQIAWQQPLAIITLTVAYTCFAAGLMSFFVAIMPDERRAGALNSIVGMCLGMAGGCTFPPEQLPRFLRDHITPLLPTDWFVQTARSLQFGNGAPWASVSLKLAVLSAIFLVLAVWLFGRRFREGVRP